MLLFLMRPMSTQAKNTCLVGFLIWLLTMGHFEVYFNICKRKILHNEKIEKENLKS